MRCENCGYSMKGLPSMVCPECGKTYLAARKSTTLFYASRRVAVGARTGFVLLQVIAAIFTLLVLDFHPATAAVIFITWFSLWVGYVSSVTVASACVLLPVTVLLGLFCLPLLGIGLTMAAAGVAAILIAITLPLLAGVIVGMLFRAVLRRCGYLCDRRDVAEKVIRLDWW